MKRDPFVIDIWSQIKFNFFFILGLIVALGVLRWSFGDSFGIIAVGVVVGAAMSLRLILFGELKHGSTLKHGY